MLEELRKHFRPEFLNRVDDTIVFHALTEADLTKIVEIQLGHCGRDSRRRRSPSCSRTRPRSTSWKWATILHMGRGR